MKKCYTCKQMLDQSNFNKNKSRKDGLNSICKECSRARSKQYYQENPDNHKLAVKKRNRKTREYLRRFMFRLKSRGCTICPEKSACCIDFHHLDPNVKEHNISHLVGHLNSTKLLKKELRKCVRLCSNCHRKLHAGLITLNGATENRTQVEELKAPCFTTKL